MLFVSNFTPPTQGLFIIRSELILAILYSKVPHMLHAKYQPNWDSGSGEEVA